MVIINYLAVIVSAIAAIVLGYFWFGALFGRAWRRTLGITNEQMEDAKKKGGMWKNYLPMLIGTLLMSGVLAHVLFYLSAFTRVVGVDAGVMAAAMAWLGFVAPVTVGSVLWEGRPWKFWFITAGYYLVSLILMGIILALWQ